MASPSVTLRLGDIIDLPQQLTAGTRVVVTSTSLDIASVVNSRAQIPPPSGAIDQTYISLFNSTDDILIRIHIRRLENAVMFNSKAASDTNFGTERRVDFNDIYRIFGPKYDDATIVVKNVGDTFDVFINTNFLGTYPKYFGGDAAKIEYGIIQGHASVLSDPLTVTSQ